MTSKAALCHILVIWGLAQVTAQISRTNIPAGVRSSMIANGWRPLTSYEHKSAAGHLASGGSLSERNSGSGPHPVHGKLQEHMSKSEKLSSKQKKQTHDYNPPSILGSFSVFGNSLAKTRGNGGESGKSGVASETREYSFLVPPPREPMRYEIDPYRKVILRENEAFLRQPSQQFIISHPAGAGPGEIRNVQYYSKGGAAASSASTHTITTLKNRPVITEYNGGASGQQSLRAQQQHVPFESLKLSNTKLFLQPPSANGAPNFGHEPQQPIDNIYERFPSAHLPHHPQKLTQESSGNFYSHINHPSPGNYNKGQTIERDPSFIVHESHELSYATPAPLQASPPGFAAFSNFRPSSSYENLHGAERYSTLRPVVSHTEKFIPSKPDNTRQKQENYQKYPKNNPNLDNSIVSPEYSNGIVNTYYISEQQSLTPPPPAAWSVSSKAKLTSDINEVLPKPDRPAKFNLDPNSNLQESQRPSHQNNVHPNYLFPRPETQQQKQQQPQQHQYFSNNPLPSINEHPETIYETPESLSLKHFNEQQYRLQQQLLQRDRERLREQQLREQQLQRQQQQIELGRITAAREREKQSTLSTPPSRPTPETPGPTVQYYDTTVIYSQLGLQGENQENQENQEIQKLPEQQFIQQEYESDPSQYQQPDVEAPVIYEPENGSVYAEPEKSTTYESTESPTTVGHRTRPRKPTTAVSAKPEHEQQQHRRRKPTTPSYEEPSHRHQEEEFHVSTLAPNPIVQSPGSLFSFPVSSETPTTVYQGTSYPSVETSGNYEATIVTTSTTTSPPRTSATSSSTTSRPRSRRPLAGNGGNGRRRRPTSTTTEEPETAQPVTYRHEDYTRYDKIESDSPRRRKPSSSVAPTTQPSYEIDPTTSTEQKRFEIQNYGHKLGSNENQDYVTELPETYNPNNEHVSSQQSYAYGNERDSAFYYTPAYEQGGQVTTGQESTDYGSSESAAGYSTPTNSLNRGKTRENAENAGEIAKNVYTNIPLEELFVNTESPIFYTTTTAAPTTTTMTTPTTTRRATSAHPTKSSYARTTGTPVVVETTTETVHTTRAPAHRMRPMRFGNSTRPRFSIKDYKTRLDYRNRKMSTTEAPAVYTRQKGTKIQHQQQQQQQQENSEKESLESTTARYRHMSRVSYRMSSTTPSYQRQRDRDSANNSTTERINRFTPKRRLSNNHLYRSKITTSTTTSQPPAGDDADSDQVPISGGTSSTSASTRPISVRNENVFSSAIRRRPQMKHAVFTQSSDLRTTRKQSTEMVPEETSFYSPAIAQQLLVTDYSTSLKNNEESDNYPNILTSETHENPQLPVTTSLPQLSSPPSNESSLPDVNIDDSPPMKLDDDAGTLESTTQSSSSNEPGQTEALVINESHVTTLDAQFEQDLFAKASQSVADLTSSASALYDKPGMFKAVSVSPSASETGSSASFINSRFKINQDKQPTLPIEAFFHQLSSSKN